VAISQIWAEAILRDARRVWDLKAVESGAGFCHLLVGPIDGDAALTMGMSQSVALVFHVVAVPSGLPVHTVALAKAFLDKAIEVLLIVLVCIIECRLDALHKHVTDGVESLLDVVIELPGGLRDGLLGKVLDERFHLGDIAMANSCQKILCC
jgi:hypothetical protein